MKKKNSACKIILIILSLLYLAHYFAVPLAIIDRDSAISAYNEQVRDEQKIETLDLKQMIPAAAAASAEADGSSEEPAVPSCKVFTWLTCFNLFRQYFTLDRFCDSLTDFGFDESAVLLANDMRGTIDVDDTRPPLNTRALRLLLLLGAVLCLETFIMTLLTNRTGFTIGLITGIYTAIVHFYMSLGIFRLADAFEKIKGINQWPNSDVALFVKLLDKVSLMKWYIALIAVPVLIFIVSVIGKLRWERENTNALSSLAAFPPQDLPDLTPSSPENAAPWSGTASDSFPKSGKIEVISGEYQGAQFSINDGDIIKIGRDPASCNIVLSDMSVARRECMLKYDAKTGSFSIMDCSSGFLKQNGKSPETSLPISMQSGDLIQIGTAGDVFRFRI